LAGFNNFKGAGKNITNTLLLMIYQNFINLFLYVSIFVFLISLISDFIKMSINFYVIPVSFMISFVFAGINRVGEINENLFENTISDLPMTALCNIIEHNMFEMPEAREMQEKLKSVDAYLF
jgi:ion channel-forming bestrophin family protein